MSKSREFWEVESARSRDRCETEDEAIRIAGYYAENEPTFIHHMREVSSDEITVPKLLWASIITALVAANDWDAKRESPDVAWTQNYVDEVKSPREKAFKLLKDYEAKESK